jgi:hypothetical protein
LIRPIVDGIGGGIVPRSQLAWSRGRRPTSPELDRWGVVFSGLEAVMTKVRNNLDRREPAPPELDYFEVETRWATWHVSTAMARHVEQCLDQVPPAGWITFVDVAGARIRVRTDAIHTIAQSTRSQRALGRARERSLRDERRHEGDWDE